MWLSCRLEFHFAAFEQQTSTSGVHKSRGCRIFGRRRFGLLHREEPAATPGCSRVAQQHTYIHTRTHVYSRALLFIPRNSRKEKADSIEPPTCTKEDLPIIFPRFVGCRPPATGCTHIRIQSSRVHRELRSPSLSLFLFLPRLFASPLFYSSPRACERERASSSTLRSLFLSFSPKRNAARRLHQIFMFQRRTSKKKFLLERKNFKEFLCFIFLTLIHEDQFKMT